MTITTREETAASAARDPDPGDARTSLVALARDALGMSLSAASFGVVYGLATRDAGFSIAEALAMSVFVLAGASQFAAVGMLVSGVPWLGIVVLTALLNARHLLYAAALAPWLAGRRLTERAAMAHVLTDETFALALAHFQRLRRGDTAGYWIATAFIVTPWIVATLVGNLGAAAIPDPTRLGLDVVFPAAMGGLAVALVTGRRELAAAVAGGSIGVMAAVLIDPAVGVVAGGVVGPLVALAFPAARRSTTGTGPATDDPRIGVRS